MFINKDVYQYSNTDLNFRHCGEQGCKPNHSHGPAIRDHYLIHYIVDGKGSYRVGEKTYYLKKGQGFLICPNVITYYEADEKEPWYYLWVGFHGVKAKEYLASAELDKENLIFTYNNEDAIEEYIRYIINTNHLKKSKDLNLLGYLYIFLGKLIENNMGNESGRNREDLKNDYVREAVNYIHANYWRSINIQDIAMHLSLNRSYLYVLFKAQLLVSPQQYLIQFKMKKACELIENTDLSISEIARSVGYDDPLMFSKTFKKNIGIAPKYYRNNNNFK